MIGFIRNISIDRLSFWLGFIAGILFWWLVSILRVHLPGWLKFIGTRIQTARESITTEVEVRFRNDIIRYVQKQHIAFSLFSLDEIAIEPRLMAPPPQITIHKQPPFSDIVDLTIPYTPDWPELAAVYKAPTLSFSEAMEGGANLILMGHPGSGKSFALALLASRLARHDPELGNFADFFPLLIHAAEIPTSINIQVQDNGDTQETTASTQKEDQPQKEPEVKPPESKTLVEVLVEIFSKRVSRLTLQRLPGFIKNILGTDHVVLLLDGLDELTPERTKKVVDFVEKFLQKYTSVRVIIAASFDNLDRLPSLGFIPVAMAAWNDEQRDKFINNWGRMWTRFITPDTETVNSVEPQFLNDCLLASDRTSTPLILTLKAWAAYAGDFLGIDTPSLLEAYIRRMIVDVPDARPALERLALQMAVKFSSSTTQQDAEKWISELQTATSIQTPETINPEGVTEAIPLQDQTQINVRSAVSALMSNGLLIHRPDPRISFIHPIFAGYLSGNFLTNQNDLNAILEQSTWIGKSLTLTFASAFRDFTPVVQQKLGQDDFLHHEQLQIARWMQVAPRNAAWKPLILRALAGTLNQQPGTLGLHARVISALALSRDTGVLVLFRQLLKSDNINNRQMAALACGILRDGKAVDELSRMLQDNNMSLIRAACLALVAIGDKNALDVVALALLQGSELLRTSAAEALANHPDEGYPALKEGSAMDDLMVRRAVVAGLARINQPWSVEILEKMQLEDKEWIVRNAAIQGIERSKQPNPYIPRPLPPLTETTWLIEFAAKLGLAVAPGKPAVDLILQALKTGQEGERLAAIEYLSMNCDATLAHNLYDQYFGGSGDILEAAYAALWLIASTGVTLPSPLEYGYS